MDPDMILISMLIPSVMNDSLNETTSLRYVVDSYQHPLNPSLRYFYVICLTMESVLGTIGNVLVSVKSIL